MPMDLVSLKAIYIALYSQVLIQANTCMQYYLSWASLGVVMVTLGSSHYSYRKVSLDENKIMKNSYYSTVHGIILKLWLP